jgi:hypothetical protein
MCIMFSWEGSVGMDEDVHGIGECLWICASHILSAYILVGKNTIRNPYILYIVDHDFEIFKETN